MQSNIIKLDICKEHVNFIVTLVLCVFLVFIGFGCSDQKPDDYLKQETAIEDSKPNRLGSPDSMLFWNYEQQISGYQNIDKIFPTRQIYAGDLSDPLPQRRIDLSGINFDLHGKNYSIEQYIKHNTVAGLLVLKNGEIILEYYDKNHSPDSKWVSFSIAKSVVALLVGAAIKDGYIDNLDSPISKYLPLMLGSEYEKVTIRQAMQMSSGIQWNEDYSDPESDINEMVSLSADEILEFLATKTRVAPPGERFNYNTAETHLIGAVLRSAIDDNLSNYLSNKIWEPFGMEADANWMLMSPDGVENGGCCISATLRDYGRIGLFVTNNGVLGNGEPILPEDWIHDMTTPSAGYSGYASQWWLTEQNIYSALGIFGQMIWIDPNENVVIVTHSTWPDADPDSLWMHNYTFSTAVRDYLKD